MKNIFLIGCGHAHLYVASHAHEFIKRGYQLTVIDPGTFWYSGLATGMLGGGYRVAEDKIDVSRLTTACQGQFIADRLVAMNPLKKILYLASGKEVSYDLVSLNLGSESNIRQFPCSGERIWTVKPIANLYKLREHLKQAYGKTKKCQIVIIGAGSTGCEIAANLESLSKRENISLSIILISSNHRVIPQASSGASKKLEKVLLKKNIQINYGERVTSIVDSIVSTNNGKNYHTSEIILANGLVAPGLIAKLGVAVAKKGELLVNDYLQSVSHSEIFGAGDCIEIDGMKLPKLGVFGVREAPILLHNLLAYLEGKCLKSYHPQQRYLSILNTGDGKSLALWDSLFWYGRTSFWIKDLIDRKFLSSYRQLYSQHFSR